MFQEEDLTYPPPSRGLPFRKNCNTTDSTRSAPFGGRRTSGASRKVAGRDAPGLSLNNLGHEVAAEAEQRFDDNTGEHSDFAEANLRHRERTSAAGQQDEKRVAADDVEVGDSQRIWGSRPLALKMFQRAAELGHAGAVGEVRRLRLRERMDYLARAGCRPPARG